MQYINLSDDVEKQCVVDREEGTYLGHPTTALLEDDKTIYTVYPKGHGIGQLVLKRSEDAGITWSERLPVPESFSTSLECPAIFRLKDKDGVSRLFIFGGGQCPFRRAVSTDNGKTWSELEPIGDFGGFFFSTMVETGKGEYLALFHDEGAFIHGGITQKAEIYRAGEEEKDYRTRCLRRHRAAEGEKWSEVTGYPIEAPEKPGDAWRKIYETVYGSNFPDGHYEIYQTRSRDGGMTWSRPERICATEEPSRLCEPCMVPSPDGKQIAVLLRENYRRSQSMFSTTDDNGKSWTPVRELNGVLTGDRHCAEYLKDGRLFISFRDMNRRSPYYGSWVAWIGTYEDLVSGREGDCKLLLKKSYAEDCAYPGVEVLKDGTVVTVTYGKWEKDAPNYVLCVRISDAELKTYGKTPV